MNKTGLIISREYLSRVKKKSFLLTTIGVPLLIMGFYAIIIAIAVKDDGGKQSIAVLDEAGIISDSAMMQKKNISFTLLHNEQHDAFVKQYKQKGYDGLLYIPKMALDSPRGVILHSNSSASLATMASVESMVNTAIENKRMVEKGIDPKQIVTLKSDIGVENTIDTKDGSKKNVAGVAYAVSLICGILIYMMMLVYGTQVMRGVTEEKTNRIAEVVVSSAKPFELMMGKIVGIGLVGLTQFAIWIIIGLLLNSLLPLFMPQLTQQTASVPDDAKQNVLAMVTQGLSSLPLLKIGLSFIFYFLGGYITYASLFAAIGSVVSDDQNEAQALVMPVMMPVILGFVIMMQAIQNPNGALAVFGSLFPLTSPVVMMGRITYDVPTWQLLLSMALLIASFIFFTWLAAKIYRTGILMYGKKPGWKEMLKWAFTK